MVARGMLELTEHGQANTTVSSKFLAKNEIPMDIPEGWNAQAQELMSYDVIPDQPCMNMDTTLPSIVKTKFDK
ncbi:hypothetical protein BELL_0374g00030 [Botrytis elliptica]|uniref:Uncharacterized protein n=1 Tax=Botrytis elliptica TaxID=278938 RepID=A0A4Z1JIX7_9HELO|nr:hypothetical protein BELL_0374g00030 [Botrytis elliptica]